MSRDHTSDGTSPGPSDGRAARRPRPRRARRNTTPLLPQILTAAVEIDPKQTAVIEGDSSLSYEQLDRRSSRIARVLVSEGVGPEDIVAIALTRSVESVTAVWSVAKSGAAFVPVDPTYPADRVQHMLTDSGARIGITTRAFVGQLPTSVRWIVLDDTAFEAQLLLVSDEKIAVSDRKSTLRADNPAYLIYTSGSTGVPKGVVVSHTGLAAFAAEQRSRFGLTPASRTLHFASPSFDASILELFMAVIAGSTMIIVPTYVFGGQELADVLRDGRVTHAFVTPAALASVDPAGLDSIEVVVVGGESCPPELVGRWAPGRQFFDAYGPTESTVVSNISTALSPGDPISIGSPIPGTNAHVLDRRLRPVPNGVAGELYLSGLGLARGYRGKPSLSAGRFVANPFVDSGTRMYRTGDIVRRDSSGSVEYVSRNDHQVKVRGFRIELGEIDTALTAHPSVSFAVTIDVVGANGDVDLVSYVRPEEGAHADPADIVAFVAVSLPKHMIPSSIMVIDDIPLTPSGKLDRARLPQPEFTVREYRAPESDSEIAVAQVFSEILGLERVGLDDDFFDLGGNSLSATRLVSRIGASLDVEFGAKAVFEQSTVAGLAAHVDELESGQRVALRAMSRPDRIPLSYAQQRMWFLNRFDNASLAYNIPIAIRLTGGLDREVLRGAISDVVDRHEVLRTMYPESDGTGYQLILPRSDSSGLLDLRTVAEVDLIGSVTEFASAAFDVTAEVPFRAALFQIAPEDAVLAINAHHIAVDGFSIGPLTRDIMIAYAGRLSGSSEGLPLLDIQYADFALWQRAVLGSEDDPESVIAQQVEYWKNRLDGLPELLELPTDRPRPSQSTTAGAALSFVIDAELAHAIEALARGRESSLFMVMQAALAIVLAKTSGMSDIAIGTAVAGRGEEALDDLVGMFVNTLVLRNNVDSDLTAAEVLAGARTATLDAFGHADVPFERLVEILDPPRATSHSPLFQVMLTLQNLDPIAFELPNLTLAAVDVDSITANFDLALTLVPSGEGREGIGGTFVYSTDLFDRSTVEGFADRFQRTLELVVADPAVRVRDLDLTSADERAAVMQWNRTSRPRSEETFEAGFDRCATATPDAPAVTFGGLTISYRDFAGRVNEAARQLISRGVGPETAVAVVGTRSVDMLTAIYATLIAGAAYVPLDPEWPEDRVRYVLDVAHPVLIFDATTDPVVGRAADRSSIAMMSAFAVGTGDTGAVRPDERTGPLRPENIAYTIFTSGSTGRPKGVSVSHRAIVNQLDWLATEFGVNSTDAILQKTPVGFDASVWELLLPLRVGARLVSARPDGHRDPRYMSEVIATEQVTIAQFVPSVLALMLEFAEAEQLTPLRAVLVGGEQLDATSASRFTELSGAHVHNVYGPTETAVQVTHSPHTSSDLSVVPIGTPVHNTRLHVLDDGLNELPIAVVGELYVAGDQLARGYASRASLTAERFVADPFADAGSRLYRTGDLVRRQRDGSLVYVGRSDAQIKLRGLRVELGEIESVLRSAPFVAAAAVSVVDNALIGYLVAREGQVVDEAVLRREAASALPEYMIPATFVILDELPTNASGKLDRRALPAPGPVTTARYRAPSTEVETLIAELFAGVLGLERVGVEDSFFALGGDSIMSIQLTSRAKARGLVFRPRDVFEAKTVGRLAELTTRSSSADAVVLAEVDGGGIGTMPMTPIVESMLERGSDFGRFTQSLAMELPVGIERSGIVTTIAAVVDHHDMLRARMTVEGPERGISVAASGSVDIDALIHRVELAPDAPQAAVTAAGSTALDEVLSSLDPVSGRVLRFVWIDFGPSRSGRIIMVAHHLIVDGVSWRIVIPDFVTAWAQFSSGVPISLTPVGTSMRTWAHELKRVAESEARLAELEYWQSVMKTPDPLLGRRAFDPAIDRRSTMESVSVTLSSGVTEALLTRIPAIFRGGVNDALLAALAMALTQWRRARGIDSSSALVLLEGHGREEDVVPGADLSRTVGWFTTVFPVSLDLSGIDVADAYAAGPSAGSAVKVVKEQLAAIPNKGIGFGLLRYMGGSTASALLNADPQVSFNYLGRVGAAAEVAEATGLGWLPATDMGDIDAAADDLAAVAVVDVNAMVVSGDDGEQLTASFAYASGVLGLAETEELAGHWVSALTSLARHAETPTAGGLTPLDVPLADVTQSEIEEWEGRYDDIVDIWPLTPLQQGLQFHHLAAEFDVDVYMPQVVMTLGGELDTARLLAAARAVVSRHSSLRTAFVRTKSGRSAQLVRARDDVGWIEFDLSNLADTDRQSGLAEIVAQDKISRFDLEADPLLRFTVVRLSDDDFRLVVTDHHIILDGWSMPILLQELLALYALRGDDSLLPRAKDYRSYLAWLSRVDTTQSLDAWARALDGVAEPSLLAEVVEPAVRGWARAQDRVIGPVLSEALADTARRVEVTMNTLTQAAWALLLARTLQRDDVVFGATVSGRPTGIDGIEQMVGLFINTVPVRVRLDRAETVESFLGRLQREQVDLLEHHHLGLSEITQRVGKGARFDSLTVFESYPVDESAIAENAASIDGLQVLGMSFAESTHYPVVLRISAGAQLHIRLEYMDDVVEAGEALGLLESLENILSVFAHEGDRSLDAVLADIRPVAVRPWSTSSRGAAAAGELSSHRSTPATDARIVDAVARLLNVDGVTIDDNFFELGGTSLDAMALSKVVGSQSNKPVPLGAVLAAPSLRALADPDFLDAFDALRSEEGER
ncbi:amino acid adenylation domain-containing protein [Rhodococcus sp. IEGM 1370]|uniref:non-ribosomal peptide synthetase n=1 Tax=Rhodococcus sp. IEGM 1370 TaxID=3082222 RepID=UPI002955C82D|nr:non-ribosomal peptide synthetase [Rhodococcus sp. IEGM 1370]MDV8075436.1 amino acid adenylation domain-containing protein [Rhodococcus sp. IEGM 1370]